MTQTRTIMSAPRVPPTVVTILIHNIAEHSIYGPGHLDRPALQYVRVPKCWLREDKMSRAATRTHCNMPANRGYGDNHFSKSCVMRRLFARALDAPGLTEEDRDELRRHVPDLDETSGPINISVFKRLEEKDWTRSPVYCVYELRWH